MDPTPRHPTDLLRRPSPAETATIPPPVETRVQKLPFNELTWENFERLCARIIDSDKTIIGCHRYGGSGEEQKGIDLIAQHRHENRVERWCYQCKKHKKFPPSLLRKTLKQIAFKADWYVVIISCDATVELRDIAHERSNTDLWDAEDLSRKLKNQYHIVKDFFGPHWALAFCGLPSSEQNASKPVQIILDRSLATFNIEKQEELKREIARILNIEPEAIIIKMVVEGSVRVVLEMPVRQAETLLSLYRQQDPQLSELIEKFGIIAIEDLEPPNAGHSGPSGPDGGSPPPDDRKLSQYLVIGFGVILIMFTVTTGYFLSRVRLDEPTAVIVSPAPALPTASASPTPSPTIGPTETLAQATESLPAFTETPTATFTPIPTDTPLIIIATPTPMFTPPTTSPISTPSPSPTPTPTFAFSPIGRPPAAPSNLQANPLDSARIRLDWNDNSNNETGFLIFGGEGSVLVEANTTSYIINNLKPNSSHCYRIIAYNDYGNSTWTTWACVATLSTTSTPTNTSTLTVTPTFTPTSFTPSPTLTNTPTFSPTLTRTSTPTPTRTPTSEALTHLLVRSSNTGGINPVEIRDLNDELLLSCLIKPNEDNTIKDCGNFEAVGIYKFLARTAKCGTQQNIFNDALPGAEVIRKVTCKSEDDD